VLQRREMLVGLNVIDDQAYDSYRREMEPILVAIGGGFGYDFRIEKTLRSESNEPINRVFTIYFPSESAMNTFFAEPRYREIKARYFDQAVTSTSILAEYSRYEDSLE
jgi:uncharacterized protein (DUF1330 family)